MIQLFSMFSNLKYVWLKSTSVWDSTIILRICTTTVWRPGSRPARSTTSLHTGQTAFYRCQLHQYFTCIFFIQKCFAQLFSTYSLALWLFGKRILAQKLLIIPYVFWSSFFWQLWPVGCAGCTDLGCFWQTNLVRNLGSNFLAGQGMQ